MGLWRVAGIILFLASTAGAGNINVYLFPGTDPSLEQQFLGSTTSQFQTTVATSPYFPGEYILSISGVNPSYVPSVPSQVVLDTGSFVQMVLYNSTYTFTIGWAYGMLYERNHDADHIQTFISECSTPSYFNDPSSTMPAVAIDPTTCKQVLNTLYCFIVSQTSGLAVVP